MIDKLIDWTFDLLIVDLMIDLLCTHILAHRWVARRLFKFKFNLKGKALLSTIASWCSVVVFYGMMSIFSLKWLENKHNCCCICALTRVFSVLIDEGQRLRAFFFNVDNQDTGTISLSDLHTTQHECRSGYSTSECWSSCTMVSICNVQFWFYIFCS